MRLRILQAEQQLPRRQQQRTALGAHSAAHLWAGWGGIPCISTSPLTALHSAAQRFCPHTKLPCTLPRFGAASPGWTLSSAGGREDPPGSAAGSCRRPGAPGATPCCSRCAIERDAPPSDGRCLGSASGRTPTCALHNRAGGQAGTSAQIHAGRSRISPMPSMSSAAGVSRRLTATSSHATQRPASWHPGSAARQQRPRQQVPN